MWSNWSRGQTCAPAEHVRPGSRAELAEAVARGRAVRVAGAGHSFSGGVATDGTLLSLERLDRVLDVDRASGLVRAEAGISLHRLVRELHGHGLALPNLGDIDAQSLAGALATGTHGTGVRLGNLSTAVAAMELVLADGSERVASRAATSCWPRASGSARWEWWRPSPCAACPPSGCTPSTSRGRSRTVLSDLDAPRRGQRPLRAVHLPALAARADAHQQPHRRARARRGGRGSSGCRTSRWTTTPSGCSTAPRGALPRAIPRINRVAGRAASKRERVAESFEVFASPRLVRFEEMEYALPRARAAEAVRACREILARHPVSFPIELRFSAGDDALLSPAHGRETRLRRRARVRGHGATRRRSARSRRCCAAGTAARTGASAPSSPPRSSRRATRAGDDFAAIRERLDPDGRFVNPWIARTLGAAERIPA